MELHFGKKESDMTLPTGEDDAEEIIVDTPSGGEVPASN